MRRCHCLLRTVSASVTLPDLVIFTFLDNVKEGIAEPCSLTTLTVNGLATRLCLLRTFRKSERANYKFVNHHQRRRKKNIYTRNFSLLGGEKKHKSQRTLRKCGARTKNPWKTSMHIYRLRILFRREKKGVQNARANPMFKAVSKKDSLGATARCSLASGPTQQHRVAESTCNPRGPR